MRAQDGSLNGLSMTAEGVPPDGMSRLIIAPVGLQPAAILAPLCSPPVRPEPRDSLALIGSKDSVAAADDISRRVGCARSFLLETEPFLLRPDVAQSLLSAARGCDEIWLLANGGRGEWAEALITTLVEAEVAFRVAGSRDHRGYIFGPDGAESSFDVRDIGCETLLEFLGLRFRRRTLSRKGASATDALGPVIALSERAGQLFAAIEADGWKVEDYRRFVLDWRRLQRLGLDYRRIMLVGLDRALTRRAIEDSIPIALPPAHSESAQWRDERMNEWRRLVAGGEAITLPEHQSRSDVVRPRSVRRESSSWTGEPLVVVMGTQPSSTLQAIWGHRPQRLFVLYDPEQPRSSALVNRLAMERDVGFRELIPVSLPLRRDLDERLTGESCAVNITPGDKLDRARILLWALAARDRHRVWQLQGSRVRTPDRQDERNVDPIPLGVWIRLHAPRPTNMGFDATRLSQRLRALAQAIIARLAGPTADAGDLRNAWRLEGTAARRTIVCPAFGRMRIADMPEPIASAFLGGRNPQESGRWWEFVVAAMLTSHGVSEVRIGVKVEGISAGFHRDELDVVTRHRAQFGYWSCKTASAHGLIPNLEEARAQADRLLGRQRLGVLVVPRVRTAPSTMEQQAPGHWRRRELGHLVDARFLADPARVRALAQQDDFHVPA